MPSILKQQSGLTKATTFFASYTLLESEFSWFGVTANNACESTTNAMQCNAILSDRHLAIFDFCCEVSVCISHPFVSRRAKWHYSKDS
jgi:hypothetical protein